MNIDSVALDGGKEVVNLFRGMFPSREDLVHLIKKQKSAILAQIDQIADLLVLFLNDDWQSFLPVQFKSLPENDRLRSRPHFLCGRLPCFERRWSWSFETPLTIGIDPAKPPLRQRRTFVAKSVGQVSADRGPSELPKYAIPGRRPARFH